MDMTLYKVKLSHGMSQDMGWSVLKFYVAPLYPPFQMGEKHVLTHKTIKSVVTVEMEL